MFNQGHFISNFQYENSQACVNNFNYEPPPMFYSHGYTPENIESTTIVDQRKSDADFFENFIDSSQDATYTGKVAPRKPFKISETKLLLGKIQKLNVELKTIVVMLENRIELSQSEWDEKINKGQAIKTEIKMLLEQFQNADTMCYLKALVEKRIKQSQRQKRLRAKWQAKKTNDIEQRARLHALIDMWIKGKREVIEAEKQKENQRKDADIILADIRGKRSDAKKFLGLLNELESLRKVKANNATARGENLSAAANQTFNNVIVRLSEQWSELDRQYSCEEQTLKLMLKTNNEKIKEQQSKNILNEWEIAIFGQEIVSINCQENLRECLINRMAWDKYISVDGQGSRIPIGWIMPQLPSSPAWKKYIKHE